MSPKAPRPRAMRGVTVEKLTHCGNIYVTVTFNPAGHPAETFMHYGKAGGCAAAIGGAVARLISYGLRSGLDPQDAIKAIEGIGCHLGNKTCMNAVAEAIAEAMALMKEGVSA